MKCNNNRPIEWADTLNSGAWQTPVSDLTVFAALIYEKASNLSCMFFALMFNMSNMLTHRILHRSIMHHTKGALAT